MKTIHSFLFTTLLLLCSSSFSQDSISRAEVERIIHVLASDSMKGRGNGSPELYKAAQFIASEFGKDSLLYFPGYNSFMHPFAIHRDMNGNHIDSVAAFNIIGVIKGKTKPDEVIIFSAHYDHIGMEPYYEDSIYNGANDNASGTTALVALAHYFAKRNDNSRTLIFCAFAGEEWGLRGSESFVKNIKSDYVVTMVNIEMIGSRSAAGKNAFFVTGSKRSGLAKILKKNLKGSHYKIVTEPSSDKMLFERSDNLPFALKGIPAHTLMCSDDSDPCYHKTCDEVKRLDLGNMTNVIKAIALAVRSLVDGSDTPSRIRL